MKDGVTQNKIVQTQGEERAAKKLTRKDCRKKKVTGDSVKPYEVVLMLEDNKYYSRVANTPASFVKFQIFAQKLVMLAGFW